MTTKPDQESVYESLTYFELSKVAGNLGCPIKTPWVETPEARRLLIDWLNTQAAKPDQELGEGGSEKVHEPHCQWQRTPASECAYRETHHYCPHPEHSCTCTPFDRMVQFINSTETTVDETATQRAVEAGLDTLMLGVEGATARTIIKRISGSAIELAVMRHSLCNDEGDEHSREELDAIKEDTVDCLTGDETGCNDPEDLNATNCELLWLQQTFEINSHAHVARLVEAATDGLSALDWLVPEPRSMATAAKYGGTTYDAISALRAALQHWEGK